MRSSSILKLALLALTVRLLHAQQDQPVPQAFITCVSSSGTASTCTLPAGTYTVTSAIPVERSGITVRGGSMTPSGTVLQRGANNSRIMTVNSGLTGVIIEYLTFDGNRFAVPGYNLSCLSGNSNYWDLDLCPGAGSCSSSGTVTVQYVDFENAPGDALRIAGSPSTVSYSNFSPLGSASATRSTAVRLYGSQSGAYYNTIDYAGTAGINVLGSGDYVYGNYLGQNRYEQSDGGPGGQLYLDAGSSNASVTANFINGNYWHTTGQPVNGCSTPNNGVTGPSGVEAYGSNQYLYNNGVIQNMGTGIQVGGSNPTGPFKITITNPWDSSDVVRCVYHNGGGVSFLGPGNCGGACTHAVTGVTLDAIQVMDNNNNCPSCQPAVYLNQSSGTGFVNNEHPGGGSFIRGTVGLVESPNPDTYLMNPVPVNVTSRYWTWSYCPAQ